MDHLDVVLEALVAQALTLDAGEALGDLKHHVAARAEQIGCVLTHVAEHVCSEGCVATTHLDDLQRLTRIKMAMPLDNAACDRSPVMRREYLGGREPRAAA